MIIDTTTGTPEQEINRIIDELRVYAGTVEKIGCNWFSQRYF